MRTFDKFFDLLNVCCFSEGKNRRKPELDPYHHSGDRRLKVDVCVYIDLLFIYMIYII